MSIAQCDILISEVDIRHNTAIILLLTVLVRICLFRILYKSSVVVVRNIAVDVIVELSRV